MPGKVLRLTLQDHDREGKRLVGAALVALQETDLVIEVSSPLPLLLPTSLLSQGESELSVHEAWLAVREDVEEELSR